MGKLISVWCKLRAEIISLVQSFIIGWEIDIRISRKIREFLIRRAAVLQWKQYSSFRSYISNCKILYIDEGHVELNFFQRYHGDVISRSWNRYFKADIPRWDMYLPEIIGKRQLKLKNEYWLTGDNCVKMFVGFLLLTIYRHQERYSYPIRFSHSSEFLKSYMDFSKILETILNDHLLKDFRFFGTIWYHFLNCPQSYLGRIEIL